MTSRSPVENQRLSPMQQLDPMGAALFLFSWALVVVIGLMPILETVLKRSPSISTPALAMFLVSVGSAAVLRRSYNWMGLVLHVVGQILIWLSIFVMSLAFALFLVGS